MDRVETDSQRLRWIALGFSRSSVARLYVLSAGVVALVLCCVLSYTQFGLAKVSVPWLFPWAGMLVLIAVAILTEKYAIRVSPWLEISASFLPFLLGSALI